MNIYRFTSLSTLALILFSSCQKNNLAPSDTIEEDISKANFKKACAVAQYRFVYGAPGNLQDQIVYNKEFDKNGKSGKITAAVYSGGAITGMATYKLEFRKNNLSVVRDGTSDTLFVAEMNSNGKVISTRNGNKPDFQYLPTSFNYSNDRLSMMSIDFAGKQLVTNFNYSGANVTSIEDVAQGGQTPARIEFQYGTTKVKQQSYFDEPRKYTWNTFTLLQFLGLFPELDGDALRTKTTVYWENNYKIYERHLVNHQVDSEGRLLQYAVSSPTDGEISMRYFLDWNCSVANPVVANGN